MKIAKKNSGKITVKKIMSSVTGLVAAFLILIGIITVMQKSKSIIGNEISTVKTVWNSVKGLGRLFTGGIIGVYKCQGNVNLIEQFDFKINGTGYLTNVMKQEIGFTYDVDGDRLVINSGKSQPDIYKISNGQIVLPLDSRCVK